MDLLVSPFGSLWGLALTKAVASAQKLWLTFDSIFKGPYNNTLYYYP